MFKPVLNILTYSSCFLENNDFKKDQGPSGGGGDYQAALGRPPAPGKRVVLARIEKHHIELISSVFQSSQYQTEC